MSPWVTADCWKILAIGVCGGYNGSKGAWRRVKCEYCGSLFQTIPQYGVCPNCGAASMYKEFQNDAGEKQHRSSCDEMIDLESYYHRYKADRQQAVLALRIDTGMGPVAAQKKIDLIFDFYGCDTSSETDAQ